MVEPFTPVETLDLWWAVNERIRQIVIERRDATGLHLTQLNNEIVRLGALVEKLSPSVTELGDTLLSE